MLMLTGFALLLCGFLILLYREKQEKQAIYNRLTKMLTDSQGDGSDFENFSEERMSQIENDFYTYLRRNRLLEKELKKDQSKVSELISDISHQVKTPLANIILYADLLDETVVDPKNKKHTRTIRDEANKLDFLIGSLILVSRLETGIIQVHPKEYLLDELIEQLKKRFYAKEQDCQISIHYPYAEGISAYFDLAWTEEAVSNVLDNALKYSPAHSTILIHVMVYDFFVRFQISDQGPGVDYSERSNIFQRFYRSEKVRDKEGVGIGLYLTRKILEQEKAYISLDKVKGEGASFSIYLPKKNSGKN